MMKDTTGNKVRARQWLSWGLATLTVLTGLALLYGLPALRYSSLTFDREEIRDRTDEVRERAEKIRERQKQERQQRKLTRPHARELTRKLEKKHRREIRNNLEKLIRHHRNWNPYAGSDWKHWINRACRIASPDNSLPSSGPWNNPSI
jgi:enoyl-CoA hydratase/carnithine racemase